MLFSNGSDLVRLQCAFVDTPEVEGITQYIGRQQGYDHAFELPEYVGDVSDVGNAAADLRAKDEFFEEAAYIVVSQQEASASNLQRKLEIGFARAAKIIDQLEAAGIIGPKRGPKPREVLITDEIALRTRLEKLRQF
jgi:S-DNA-T family DNA segregation ATPase FtsK/SpoIIIE